MQHKKKTFDQPQRKTQEPQAEIERMNVNYGKESTNGECLTSKMEICIKRDLKVMSEILYRIR